MIYPENFETLCGFQRIREIIDSHCFFEENYRLEAQLAFSTEVAEIKHRWDCLDQWNHLRAHVPAVMDFTGCSNVLPVLNRLGIENYAVQPEALFAIASCIEKFLHLKKFIAREPLLYPALLPLVETEEGLEPAATLINKVIDSKGNIRPNASVELGKLLAEISRLETRARSIARHIFTGLKAQGLTAETDLTVREGRLVIPVIAEHKRKVNGFLKDVSATGKILYIEPTESIEINNLLAEKRHLKDVEIERILRKLTAELKPYKPLLVQMLNALNDFDAVQARLYLCDLIKAERPMLENDQQVVLKQAYHPQLWLKNKINKQKTIPLDIEINNDSKIVLISGPNAGGKSIALKTVLLLQYMAQCGLFISAAPNSKVGIFENISAIIGDGQDVEEGLSTFSAHLNHLKKLYEVSNSATLFGIDEIGTGTDPHFGAPIAIVLLNYFLSKGSRGIVTSHYSELKNWAANTTGVTNASMLYDVEALTPLFILKTGKPGSSFAVELLKKNAFPVSVLNDIEKMVGEEKGNTEKLMVELQQKEHEINELLEYNKDQRKYLDTLINEYQQLRDKLSVRKTEIVLSAKKEAKNIVDSANTLVEHTVKKIKEKKASGKIINAEKNKLEHKKQQLQNQIEQQVKESVELIKAQTEELPPLEENMEVKHAVNDNMGVILELKPKKSLVLFGILKMWVDNEFLIPVIKKAEAQKSKGKGVSGINWVNKMSSFNTVLDVRGLTGEEAVLKAGNWLSEANMLGQFKLKIVHGRGTGAVRKAIYDYMKTQNFIKSWKYEHTESGGDGATLIDLI